MGSKFKILSATSRERKSDDYYFTILDGRLLVKSDEGRLSIPIFEEIRKLNIQYENEFFLGAINKKSCFCIETYSNFDLPSKYELIPLREIGPLVDEELFLIAGRANQILNWDKTHKFCGKCGSKTQNKKEELAKVCPSCGHVMYPVICPAIIVAVTRGEEILLAHNSGFKNNMYSLIAGFVEAGEDLISTVKREVFEEVGIKIKNIKFFNSSPWSFPNSLMIGFFAEYESGEIKVDGKEIVHADWFTKDNFPTIPKKFTLARKIIDEFVNREENDGRK
ncbi:MULTISPECIES: NAD(+) diphosphatase [unclassified Clostridium]|uniref:NAD(+) diphosphatase n=1 Tax=unclassified Clostridium TaxID=2614128 RepID=UPI00029749B5|nr:MULTISPECIES: NAD(+) diphosphatase [unclassified Clostridium]EKQ53054.1 MAG: Zn-finger containing NTP pyrophosphohydrolase [Clostridium sp. Maddingley MBC34-26]